MKILSAALFAGLLSVQAAAAEGFFDSKGVKIRYVTEGKGVPVVLIHGWMGDSSMWGKDATGETKLDASPGFQAIAIDCRGHGKSGKPHDVESYGPEMANDVIQLLDHLKIEKAHLVGYSMGSFIAGRVAATHPKRVLSVIYGGQAPLLVGRDKSGSNEAEIFAKAVEEGKGLGSYLLAVMPPNLPRPTLQQANAIANTMYAGKDLKAFAQSGLSLGRLEVRAEDLRKCKAPALFLYGENESEAVKSNVAAARKILAHSQVKTVPGADHMTTLVKPEFGASILEFLRTGRVK